MKRRIACFFLCVYFLSASPVSELCKLPVLISHFNEHQAMDKGLSFIQFLALHYDSGRIKNPEHEKDMKLPFKTTTESSFSVFYINSYTHFTFKKIAYISQQKLPIYYPGDAYSYAYLHAIWQPPRTC